MEKGKYIDTYYLSLGRVTFFLGTRFKVSFTNWSYDRVMVKHYKWSLYLGFLEVRLYQPEVP